MAFQPNDPNFQPNDPNFQPDDPTFYPNDFTAVECHLSNWEISRQYAETLNATLIFVTTSSSTYIYEETNGIARLGCSQLFSQPFSLRFVKG
jgi:hypothetical protein